MSELLPSSPDQQVDAALQERIYELLRGKFRPAAQGEADNYFTTDQIFSILVDHEPALAETKHALRGVLLNLEFQEHMMGDTCFWAVRSAAPSA